MSPEIALETRSKILDHARRLFALYGYNGTSVREIAKRSEVNLSAISYHFNGKANLYFQVMTESYDEAYQIVEEVSKETDDLEQMSLQVFNCFLKRKESLRLTIKLMLTDVQIDIDDPSATSFFQRFKGPPGGEFFATRAEQQINRRLSNEDRLWVSKTVFGLISHWATVCASNNYPQLVKEEPLLSEDQFRHDLRRLIGAVLNELKSKKI